MKRFSRYYLQQYSYRLMEDRTIPKVTRRMIELHLCKPWIPGFIAPIIRAVHPGSEDFLDMGMTVQDGWHLPSKRWWLAHAHASHPPDGSGCDVDVHTEYLSAEGSVHEFDYAALMNDGIHVLGQQDFEAECAWWAAHKVSGR